MILPPNTWEEAIERLPDGLKKALQAIKQRVLTFGDDVDTYTTRANFIFQATRVFAEISQVPKAKRTRLPIRVRPEGFNIPENETAVVHGLSVKRVPDSYLWTVNHEFELTESTDLDAVMKLLRQSYDGARRRS